MTEQNNTVSQRQNNWAEIDRMEAEIELKKKKRSGTNGIDENSSLSSSGATAFDRVLMVLCIACLIFSSVMFVVALFALNIENLSFSDMANVVGRAGAVIAFILLLLMILPHFPKNASSPNRKKGGMKARRILGNTVGHIVLTVLSIIWLIPLFYLVLQSLKKEHVAFSTRFFPKDYSLDNYKELFSAESWETGFMKWYGNTLIVSIFSALFTTIFVLMVAYAFSRVKFKARKPIMNVMLILGMFPGFMSMTAIYFLLKVLNAPSTIGLILVYSGGAAMSYYVSKGFFDTIPKSLDEAARIDGASRFRVFYKVILPLSKPIIIYTVLVSFIAPWCDFIFASLITGADRSAWTVAVGMRDWVTNRSNLNMQFGVFCAASVLVATPITALFMWLQKYYVQGVTGGAVKG